MLPNLDLNLEITTAFILGLVGSLHCAGMCGPLALALPGGRSGGASFLIGRLNYNLGRLVAYGALGALFGLVGQTLALAGLQRWLSLGAGVALLAGLIGSSRYVLARPVVQTVAWLKTGFARLLQRRSLSALLCLGVLNGFLPCGLVYAACAGAVASGGLVSGIEYMVIFGAGTIPMMLGIGLAGHKLQMGLRLRFQKLVPVFLVVLSALLILRGLSLGIPYLGPDLSGGRMGHGCCH